MQRLTRRAFCEVSLLGVGASVGLSTSACRRSKSSGAAPVAPASATPESPLPHTFTVATFATLSAVCERILPRDQDPGATDLGVPTFIDAMVATPELASTREMLVKYLPLLEKESQHRIGRGFVDSSTEEQDKLLDAWQHGSEGRQHFFDAMLSLTMEGAFGDPKYGGNLDGRGFALIGFRPDPPLKKMAAMPGMVHTHDDARDR